MVAIVDNLDVELGTKVLEWYPMAFAIFDQDLDGDLDCLYAVRTAMDLDARTATYVFKFGGRNGKDKQSFILHAKPGPAPETVLVTEGDGDEEENIATVAYAEYKTCSVWQVPIMNRPECILWTPPETLNAIPQTCMDQFREICELGVPVYDESCDYIE
ncbi:uncharacterized protein LOC144167402 isoform X2 [Haemaphysalis longicornis]